MGGEAGSGRGWLSCAPLAEGHTRPYCRRYPCGGACCAVSAAEGVGGACAAAVAFLPSWLLPVAGHPALGVQTPPVTPSPSPLSGGGAPTVSLSWRAVMTAAAHAGGGPHVGYAPRRGLAAMAGDGGRCGRGRRRRVDCGCVTGWSATGSGGCRGSGGSGSGGLPLAVAPSTST